MRCPSCDHANRSDHRFCAKCGAPLGEICAGCGTQNDPDDNFCGNCGKSVSGAVVAAKPSTSGRAPSAAPSPEAERRHLTVMFCDLVSSTTLAECIDDEDLREVIRRYYDVCAETIERYEGHVARYIGDGLLVYFGYPRAHEDDAERAVRAGFDMVANLERDFGALNATLEPDRGMRLAVRIGVHTGQVVVGDLGGGERREALALGETVNIAARLQSIAVPDTVVISAATRRLVRGIFVLEDLGPQRLKGVSASVAAFRVIQPSGVRSRLDLAEGTLTPFVGRHAELATLLEAWERVQERDGQTILITGEAGVGKSRLVLALRERLADAPHTWLECRCSPYTQQTAFHPIVELVAQGLGFQAADTAAEKIVKLERGLSIAGFALPETVPLFADFLSVALTDAYAPLGLHPDVQRRKTLEALAAWNLTLGEVQPVVLLMDDLHWCDPSSLDLLGRFIDQSPTARVMLVCTARPDFTAPWPARSSLTPLHLARLTKRQAREMVAALSDGRRLPEQVVELIVDRADGVPLYLEELARMVLESGLLAERDGRWELTAPLTELAIPTTLQDSLMARLDRLSAVKEVAQRAAVLGREFSYELLAAVAGLDEPTLRNGLMRLVETELLFVRGEPPDATYTFKHALIQDAAYQSLLKRTRQGLHARIAQALDERFPERAATEPEALGHHYEAAGLVDQAVAHYERAGERAAMRSAHAEAVAQLRKAIALLGELPEGHERDAREAPLQLALAQSLIPIRGYAHSETEAVCERARIVGDAAGNRTAHLSALLGLAMVAHGQAQFERSLGFIDQVLALTSTLDDALIETAYDLKAMLLYYEGKFAASLEHSEEVIRRCDSARHQRLALVYGVDPGVSSRAFSACALWQLGHPNRALARAREATAFAVARDDPFGIACAQFLAVVVRWLRRDVCAQREGAEEAIHFSEAHGFPLFLGVARALRGNALADPEEVMMGMALAASTGNQGGAPVLFATLVEAHLAKGQHAEALGTLETALAVSAATGQRCHEAELHRLKGDVLLASHPAEGERLFRRALEIAREQQARGFELRAAMSLARFWQRQDKSADARALLGPVYASFSEGFDTHDLIAAKALLKELE